MKRGLTAVAVLAGAMVAVWGWASAPRCPWERGAPSLVGLSRAKGPLRAGAAKVRLEVPLPSVQGGYPPPRVDATRFDTELSVRALHLDIAGNQFAVVVFDALLVPPALVEGVRAGHSFPIWVAATHAHSSLGGYDSRLAAQVGALGRFEPARLAAMVSAGQQALQQAQAAAAPALLSTATAKVPGFAQPRSGSVVDEQLTLTRFVTGSGEVVAQWLIANGHPALVDRHAPVLDGDWPQRAAVALERERAGSVALVTQGAGGNASARLEDGEGAEAFARRLVAAARALPQSTPAGELDFGLATASVTVGKPESVRLVPGVLEAATDNVLCEGQSNVTEVAALRLGPVTLLAVPLEPSGEAGAMLSAASGAGRVVGLVNGYFGYVEPEAVVKAVGGESRRQYFGPTFLEQVSESAALAARASGLRARE